MVPPPPFRGAASLSFCVVVLLPPSFLWMILFLVLFLVFLLFSSFCQFLILYTFFNFFLFLFLFKSYPVWPGTGAPNNSSSAGSFSCLVVVLGLGLRCSGSGTPFWKVKETGKSKPLVFGVVGFRVLFLLIMVSCFRLLRS